MTAILASHYSDTPGLRPQELLPIHTVDGLADNNNNNGEWSAAPDNNRVERKQSNVGSYFYPAGPAGQAQ